MYIYVQNGPPTVPRYCLYIPRDAIRPSCRREMREKSSAGNLRGVFRCALSVLLLFCFCCCC
jgi:hypothetical protein